MSTRSVIGRTRGRVAGLPARFGGRGSQVLWCYLFLAPLGLLFVAFTAWPAVASWWYALQDWSGLSSDMRFVGVENFVAVASDSFYWNAVLHSVQFTAAVVPIQLALALLLAIVLNNPRLRGASVYRTLFFLPVVTTTAIVAVIMVFIWSPFQGPINIALQGIGAIDRPIDWLGDPGLAMWVVIAIGIWKTLGVNMVYWLAGLQTIPRELYEAAAVDGANAVQMFRYITAPLLAPVASVIALLAVVNSLKVFDLVKALTDGGPFYATDVVTTYLYRYAFSVEAGIPRLGYASASGVLFGVMTMLVVGAYFLVGRRRQLENASLAGGVRA